MTPEVLKIILARKRFLEYLNIMYGTPLELNTLFLCLSGLDYTYDLILFSKDVKYLRDKGYIEFVDERIGGAKEFLKKVTSLTSKGKEIAEGTLSDLALET